MSTNIYDRLNELAITLPKAPAPAANYVPFVRTNNLVFISGQISSDENGLIIGKLGENMEINEGYSAARACGLALISQLEQACDSNLNKLLQVIKLTGFVNSTLEFNQHPLVINGSSDLMVEVFGNRGKHARAAVGSSSLPLGVAVEVEGIFEIE